VGRAQIIDQLHPFIQHCPGQPAQDRVEFVKGFHGGSAGTEGMGSVFLPLVVDASPDFNGSH
jgi:hypothetical protein